MPFTKIMMSLQPNSPRRRIRVARALALALAGALTALPDAALAQARVERGWRLDRDGAVRIHNFWGSVRVVGWDRDSVAVTGTVAAGQRYFGGGGGGAVKMAVEGQEETSDQPEPPGSALVIRVPAGARVWVKTIGASIEVSGVRGGVDVASVGGDIRVTGSPRELLAHAMQGALDLTVTSPFVRAKTAGGAITLRGAVEDLAATTVSGRLIAETSGIRRAFLDAVSGDVRFAGSLDRDGALNVDTHSGTVELALPADISAEFALQTVAAPIENGLTTRRAVPSRQRGGEELYFTAGGGGAQIRVRTFKGRVTLMKR